MQNMKNLALIAALALKGAEGRQVIRGGDTTKESDVVSSGVEAPSLELGLD